MTTPLPAFVFWICGLSALLLVVVALPLWLGRVPPNSLYGARFPATLATPAIWYPINRRAGRDLALIGVAYLLAICALVANPVWRRPLPLLVVTAVFVVVLVTNTFMLWRRVDRLARMRGPTKH